ncbi:sensor histidine kinase [Sinimarinibacterium sp. CAU 1509]|uniref:sensor histidine kinase n=1 Tax=Sinimarinibacterium sp. CAU 1509 TaxID=2562283 RepID=UPI00146B907B|nr:ATP-binding protein [Sinimarinibacterium sp. CAU 1509]
MRAIAGFAHAAMLPVTLMLCAMIALGSLALDLTTPRGVADGMLYVALVLPSLWLPWRGAPFALAALGTALTAMGYWGSPPGAEQWIVLTNRTMALAIVWLTAVLCYLHKGALMRLRNDEGEAERRIQELQANLYHIARRGELGEMVSAIAHELNQPLTAVCNYVAAARRLLPPPEQGGSCEAVELMAKVTEQANRAAQVPRQVLRMMKAGSTERTADDLNAAVEEVAAFALIGSRQLGIHATLDLAADLPPCLMNRTQVQQVLLNLARNAIEAVHGCARRDLSIRTARAGDGSLEVAVADSGDGLAKEVQERLFMPFVTTKPNGSGIGLCVAHTIVGAHGGRLWAEANPGGGTVFRFTLPAAVSRKLAG